LFSNIVLFPAFVAASVLLPPTASSIISAVSHCLLTMEAWFNPRPVHVGFVVDRGTETGFSSNTSVSQHHYHSISAPYSFIHMSLM
jgi:hypothetical protein